MVDSGPGRGQIYTYYFDRQGVIQDALYEEIGALKLLSEATEVLGNRHPHIAEQRHKLTAILRAQAVELLDRGFKADVSLLCRSSLGTLTLLDALEEGCDEGSSSQVESSRGSSSQVESSRGSSSQVESTRGSSSGVRWIAMRAVEQIATARSKRISAIAAELPLVQLNSQRIITIVVLLGFVLVDLGAPKLEALLFSAVSSTFVLLNIFLADLADPFGGSWNVDAAREELEALVDTLDAVRQKKGAHSNLTDPEQARAP